MHRSSSRRWGTWALALGLAVVLLVPATALAAPVLIDDTAFTYSPSPNPPDWIVYTDASMSGGSNHYSGASGAYAEVTFSGVAVTFISTTGNNRGDARIYLDGTYQTTVSQYSGPIIYQQELWSKSGLTPGTHTLRVERAGTGSGVPTNYLEIDAIRVEPAPVVSTPASSWWSIVLLAIAALGVVGIAKRNFAR